MRYTYNPKSRRYHDLQTGRFVTEKAVRAAIDTVITVEQGKLQGLAQQLVDGKISLAEWQQQSAALLKTLHVATGVAANGGFANMSQTDYGFVGSQLKKQYGFLRGMAQDLKNGVQALGQGVIARIGLYAQAARGTFEAMRQRVASLTGQSQEKSILGAADHCNDCVGEAAKGWAPLGSLIPIGERACKANCHCTMDYQ